MARKRRIPRTREQRLRACEAHLYFLWDDYRLYSEQPDRFTRIASELRVLVCETRTNKPLLLDLMDEYGFSYEVQPEEYSLPLHPQPLPMIGWQNDPLQEQLRQLSEELSEAIGAGDDLKRKQVEEKFAALAKPVSFREWVNKGLAVYIKPYDYSYRELVLAIAQQYGGSHEDESVEEPMIHLQSFIIGGHRGDIAPLLSFTTQVLKVGSLFIAHLVQQHGYEPRYYKAPSEKSDLSSSD